MKRLHCRTKYDIINLAKRLEFGETCFKIDNGSVVEALTEARYYLEHGMSRADYTAKQQKESKEYLDKLWIKK